MKVAWFVICLMYMFGCISAYTDVMATPNWYDLIRLILSFAVFTFSFVVTIENLEKSR